VSFAFSAQPLVLHQLAQYWGRRRSLPGASLRGGDELNRILTYFSDGATIRITYQAASCGLGLSRRVAVDFAPLGSPKAERMESGGASLAAAFIPSVRTIC
jgi:hypothetical protein